MFESTIPKSPDRFWLYASFTCIVIASTFTVSMILGKVIFVLLQTTDFSQLTADNKEYPGVLWSIFQIMASGFFIFVTPIFFSTILSVMPKPKIFITPAISQIIVFCLFVMYLVFKDVSEPYVFLILFAVIPFMLMPAIQHKIVKDLVGVSLEQIVRHSIKVKNVTIDQVFDVFMDSKNRDELGLSEKYVKTDNQIEIFGKKSSRSVRIGLKERNNYILINIIFYRLERNNFINDDLESFSTMRLLYLKKLLKDIDESIRLEDADSEKNTSYLLLSISKDFEGTHKRLAESVIHSKLKIFLFLAATVIIGILFLYQQFQTGTIAILSIILYIVFEATLYKRNRSSF